MQTFKNELRNYRDYQTKLQGVNELIDLLYYELSGVSAIDYSKLPIKSQQEFSQTKQRIYDELDKQKERKRVLKIKIQSIEDILENMPEELSEAAIKIFADHIRAEVIAREFYLTDKGLMYRINKAIKSSLRK